MDPSRRSHRRRRWAATLGAVTLTGLGLALAPPAGAHDSPVLPQGEFTEEQITQAETMVHDNEAVLPELYSDPSVLPDLGFYDFGVTAPGGYDHWLNPGWIDDGRLLDPERPEALVYQHTDDGGVRLAAAMYYLDSEHSMENLPEEYAWIPGWHVHEELCADENGQFTGIVGPDGTCSVGEVIESPPMAHVWVIDNECGHRFAAIGVGGVDCDVHGGGPHGGEHGGHGHEPPDTTPPPTTPPGGTPPSTDEPTPTTPSTAPPTTDGGSGAPMAPPARPIVRQPTYTG